MNLYKRAGNLIARITIGLFIFLLAVLPVLAAEAGETKPEDSSVGLVFRWLNFVIVFGGIGFLIAKHGGAFFRNNAKSIAASITEASAAKAEADRELREVEAKIARLDQETKEMHEAGKRDSLAEAERLRVSGLAEIEKIKLAARAELSAAERAAQQELRAVAASMAVDRAAVLVTAGMNAQVRAKMFRTFLSKLERNTN
jgi:F-type H+-transporting ATPase subunit b